MAGQAVAAVGAAGEAAGKSSQARSSLAFMGAAGEEFAAGIWRVRCRSKFACYSF